MSQSASEGEGIESAPRDGTLFWCQGTTDRWIKVRYVTVDAEYPSELWEGRWWPFIWAARWRPIVNTAVAGVTDEEAN